MEDKELLEKARTSLEGGATGLVFGRNLWQRPFKKALEMAGQIRILMKEFAD